MILPHFSNPTEIPLEISSHVSVERHCFRKSHLQDPKRCKLVTPTAFPLNLPCKLSALAADHVKFTAPAIFSFRMQFPKIFYMIIKF